MERTTLLRGPLVFLEGESLMTCANCGVDTLPGMGLCPGCSQPLHDPASPAGKLESRLAGLRDEYKRGAISSAQYEALVADLQFRDSGGSNWWLNGMGRWARWDGQRWEAAEPTQPAPVQTAPKRRGIHWWIPAAGLAAAVLAVGVLAASVVLYGGWVDYTTSPVLVEGVEPPDGGPSGYILLPEQQAVVDEHGRPEGFSILFYDEPLDGAGAQDVRLETWDYYQEGLQFTFKNGDLVGQEPLDLGPVGALMPQPYAPEQFLAYMSLDDVLSSTGMDRYLEVPLEDGVVADGAVYYGEGLTFGLKGGELRYIEALAIEGEG